MKRAVDLPGVILRSAGESGESDQRSQQRCGLTAYPSGRWRMNCNHFQLVMLAYNLNCWLILFHREEEASEVTTSGRQFQAGLAEAIVFARIGQDMEYPEGKAMQLWTSEDGRHYELKR